MKQRACAWAAGATTAPARGGGTCWVPLAPNVGWPLVTDPEFIRNGRDTSYYVRAIQEPSPAVNGGQLRCKFDSEGRCTQLNLCSGDPAKTAPADDCLEAIEERVREDGSIRLLQNQTFTADGKMRGELEKEIHQRYVPNFYRTMTVSVTPKVNTQFYYVYGEVKTPDRQVWLSRITVLKAIASANGFTDFARKKDVRAVLHAVEQGLDDRVLVHQRSLNSGCRFSKNASMPSAKLAPSAMRARKSSSRSRW